MGSEGSESQLCHCHLPSRTAQRHQHVQKELKGAGEDPTMGLGGGQGSQIGQRKEGNGALPVCSK